MIDWPAALKSQRVTAGSSAQSLSLLPQTREIIIVNLADYAAYVNVNGTATGGSGDLYIPGSTGYERVVPVGNGSQLSYIRAGTSNALLDVTEVG